MPVVQYVHDTDRCFNSYSFLILKYIDLKSLQFSDSRTGEEMHLAYSDYGSGQPVIFIHGRPSSREMWEYQLGDVVNAGFRVVNMTAAGLAKAVNPGWDTIMIRWHPTSMN